MKKSALKKTKPQNLSESTREMLLKISILKEKISEKILHDPQKASLIFKNWIQKKKK